jgi:excisionase family DNA binding protein
MIQYKKGYVKGEISLEWLKIEEVAKYFKVSRSTIYRWEKKGLIKIYRIDNQVPRIAKENIEKMERELMKKK